jgi:glucose-6-phosphate isomerase
MLGIDIFELLAGARYMMERGESHKLWQNPAYLAGAMHYLADVKKGLNIVVMMPYCDALYQLAFWFRQLWAESLGKAKDMSGKSVHVGQTPVVALGATDQHSQLQLYTEGPFNKMVTFLMVENHGVPLSIPLKVEKEYAYLSGHTLGELINIEAQATQLALAKAGRSSMSLTLPEVNPFIIGQLLFLFEVQTVFTAGLYNINPLDQPGVESSKNYIQGIMGRRGFEGKSKEVADWQQKKGQYSI